STSTANPATRISATTRARRTPRGTSSRRSSSQSSAQAKAAASTATSTQTAARHARRRPRSRHRNADNFLRISFGTIKKLQAALGRSREPSGTWGARVPLGSRDLPPSTQVGEFAQQPLGGDDPQKHQQHPPRLPDQHLAAVQSLGVLRLHLVGQPVEVLLAVELA